MACSSRMGCGYRGRRSSIDGDYEKRSTYVNEKDSSQGLAMSLDEKTSLRERMKMRGSENKEGEEDKKSKRGIIFNLALSFNILLSEL